jgi:hypothetical protein
MMARFNERSIEIERHNVTLAQFLSYIKRSCSKKGFCFELDRGPFEKPESYPNSYTPERSYHVKDGKKICYDGLSKRHYELDASEATAKAETLRILPLDYQTYVLNFDGSCFNEICEFTYDDEKRGHGYYFQLNKETL